MELIVNNDNVILSSFDPMAIKLVDTQLSYRVKGYFFSYTYKKGLWDGKQHLLKYNRKVGYHLPTGLLPDLITILRDSDCAFHLQNQLNEPDVISDIEIKSDSQVLRLYQQEAVNVVLTQGWARGRCILKMPARSGKTLTAAHIINRMKHKTLFVVPSEMLLSQTLGVFRATFDCPIGQCGDGVWQPDVITVATAQTLNARKKTKAFQKLFDSLGLIIFDECHHLVAKTWQEVVMKSGIRYRVGLSATAYLASKSENEKSTIWLKACCGPIVHDIPISSLVEQGFLTPLDIQMIAFDSEWIQGEWREAYNKGIVHCLARNQIIVSSAVKLAHEGKVVLIHANELDHIKNLSELLAETDAAYHVMVGYTSSENRRQRVSDLKSKQVSILLGNLFKEGVDIPECDAVINAAAGQSEISTIQKLRNLTKHDGKQRAVLIDIADLHNMFLAKHAAQRLKTYKKEPSFHITMVKYENIFSR